MTIANRASILVMRLSDLHRYRRLGKCNVLRIFYAFTRGRHIGLQSGILIDWLKSAFNNVHVCWLSGMATSKLVYEWR